MKASNLLRVSAFALFAAFAAPAAAEVATGFATGALSCQAATTYDELTLLQGAQHSVMRQANPQIRTAARAMGFGGVAQYAALPGVRAMLRLTASPTPTFVLAIPNNMQPQGLFTLARLEVRRNNTREISIGGGYMSYSTGVPADRQIALDAREAANQRGAPAGTVLYELTPTAPLAPGEYVMIISTGQAQTAGMMGGVGAHFYDFGVD
ncbi:MAG TPA: hypothetical protein VG841_09325 [Caulobacterales bacterium]|nr:hypothetical protein [Caulobacterales bacterium]